MDSHTDDLGTGTGIVKPGPHQPLCVKQTQTVPSCAAQHQAEQRKTTWKFTYVCWRFTLHVCIFGCCILHASCTRPAKLYLRKLDVPTNKFSFDVPTKFGSCSFAHICTWCNADCHPDRLRHTYLHLFNNVQRNVVRLVWTRHPRFYAVQTRFKSISDITIICIWWFISQFRTSNRVWNFYWITDASSIFRGAGQTLAPEMINQPLPNRLFVWMNQQ